MQTENRQSRQIKTVLQAIFIFVLSLRGLDEKMMLMTELQGALARRVIGEERGAFHTRRAQSR